MSARARTIVWRCVAAVAVLLTIVAASGRPALAHEGEESGKASDLVKQAIAIMANEPDNVDAAMDKLTDAGNAEDKSGVDLLVVAQARDALTAKDVAKAKALAEQSIGAQPPPANADVTPIGQSPATTVATTPSSMPAPAAPAAATMSPAPTTMMMASGAEPGPAAYDTSLSVRPELAGRDWTVLFVSVAVGLLGVYLALRFRPRHREVTP